MKQLFSTRVGVAGPLSRKRRMRKLAKALALGYFLLCVIMFSIQNWMIFPGHATQGQAQSILAPSPEYELVHLKSADGEAIAAIFGSSGGGDVGPITPHSSPPTVLFFYGNAMCMADCLGQFREFRQLGANVMLVDYPGYGMSGGEASEKSLYAAGDAAYEYLLHRSDIDHAKIIAAGWSLGAAVAINLAAHRPVAGLATLSAFTSMPDMAHNLVPWLPTSLLLRSRFDNLSKIGTIGCPIFIAHGVHDSIVPFAMSRKLIAAAKGTVTSVDVDSDHNDIFETGGEGLNERLKGFLAQTARVRG